MTNVVVVHEEPPNIVVVRDEPSPILVLSTQGPSGPPGPQGEPGPRGESGAGILSGTFHWDQAVASNVWVIPHNLGFVPQVTVTDSTGRVVEGDVVHNSVNQVTVSFTAPFAGTADMS